MFLDLILYKTSIPTTLVPKSTTSSPTDNSKPKSLRVPDSLNVCLMVFSTSLTVVVVVVVSLPLLAVVVPLLEPVTRLPIFLSFTKKIFA